MNYYEIRRRLLFIIDDASRLLSHLEQAGDMDEFTGFADSGYTHLSNIQIAADLNDTESNVWKDVHSMDGETMELIIGAFNMKEQMLRQLALQSSKDNLVELINEMYQLKN
jgi:hypothetical protein